MRPNGFSKFRLLTMTNCINKNSKYQQRIAWEKHYGRKPLEGMVIAHNCDNPYCINIEHLKECTQAENLADMKERDRSAKGSKHRSKKHPHLVLRGEKIGNSKLTDDQVKEIRLLYKKGTPKVKSQYSLSGLAEKYGVAFQTISKIINEKAWK